jgi:hypothetical protein
MNFADAVRAARRRKPRLRSFREGIEKSVQEPVKPFLPPMPLSNTPS